MFHPRSMLPALVAVLTVVAALLTTVVLLPVAPAGAVEQSVRQTVQQTRPEAEGDAPLVVTVGSLSPSTVPVRGPVRVTGTVTNRDNVAWSTINLYPFVSATPMTTRAELVEAAATDPTAEVGERKLDGDGGAYAAIDRLEPGETAAYQMRIPRSALGIVDQGVYWFGVHALGESAEEGRVDGADGRARTFLPYVRGGALQAVDVALVVPLRAPVRFASDGSLAGLEEWTATLAGGSLDALVELGAAAGSRPLTWLVDPAVLDAATRLAAGNPGRSLAPTIEPEVRDPDAPDPDAKGDPSPSSSASPSEPVAPSGDASAEPDGEEEEEEPDPEVAPAANAADAWLEQLRSALGEARDGTSQVLTLPYGDLDVPAAAEHDPEAYHRARQRSGATLRLADVPADPAVSPPSGVLDGASLGLVDGDETLLVTDEQLVEKQVADGAPAVATVDGRRLVLASSAAATGGPGPDPRLATVALRQRILAEAAVRRLSPGGEPLVVVIPTSEVPRSGSAFFAGLDVDWLRLTTVADVERRAATDVPADALAYPARQERRELDSLDFTSADRLTRAGSALQNLLVRNDQVGREVADQALTSLSYSSRESPLSVRAANDGARAWIENRLGGVRIDAPNQVTLSSASGQFSATVENTLDQPVTVSIKAFVDDDMEISTPESTVQLAPRSRRTVLLTAATERQGIHNVTLVLTDVRGTPLGSSDELPIRAAQVSGVIWLIIGIGCALLFGAIAVRLFRRVRAARRGQAAAPVERLVDAGSPVAQT